MKIHLTLILTIKYSNLIDPSPQERHRSKTPICKLTLHNLVLQLNPRHSELKHSSENITISLTKNSNAQSKVKNRHRDEDIHGVINPEEAKAHVEAMENLMMKIEAEAKESMAPGLLDTILGDLKQLLSNLIPQMQLADTVTVAQAIRDKNFDTLLPKSDEIDKILEEKLSSEDIPEAAEVLKITQREGKMSERDQEWWQSCLAIWRWHTSMQQ